MSDMDGFKSDLEEIAKEIDSVIRDDALVSDDASVLDNACNVAEYDVSYYPAQAVLVLAEHVAQSNKLFAIIAKQLLSIQLQMAENAQANTVYRGRE